MFCNDCNNEMILIFTSEGSYYICKACGEIIYNINNLITN